ncbi:anti-sigma factor family protein [Pleomorphochaeta sp. DL1XJH-081]|jgi:anti-sigma factor RsiW|uniref:anti-sigma factor family protein n=1 Tax=Pleomorphochaeta sp. DL1XJH-081 TaxID=3409690 RepID=UPI003BB5FA73
MCLDDQILNTYLDGELSEPWKTQVEEHLNYCTACKTRFEQLRSLHRVVSGARLEEQEIAPHQDKVFQFIEKNYMEKRSKVGFFHRDFRIKTPTLLMAAAAFIFVLVGALLIGPGSATESDQLIPRVVPASEGALVQVRATEGLAASQVLENFPLEDILKYLDSKGYEVDLRVKGIQPMGEQQGEEPIVE